jgi:hypothetical protein
VGVAVAIAVACGSQSGDDAPVPAPIDAGNDVVVEDANDGAVPTDAGDAGDAADAAREATAFCSLVDAQAIYVCETFDDAGAVPPPFAPDADIPATIDVSPMLSLSPPRALRTAFTGDAGFDYNSATGAAIRATIAKGVPRARLSFAVRIEGTFDGEVDVVQLTWSASPADTYWLRFGTNTGLFWRYDSAGFGSLSINSFPTGAWFRVVVEVDLAAQHYAVTVGGVRVFDGLIAPGAAFADASAASSVELALGAAAVSTGASAGATVYIDDVVLTDF